MSRSAKNQEKMFALVEGFQQSKLTRQDFCIQEDIPVARFYYWQKKYRARLTEATPGFVQLRPDKKNAFHGVEPMIVLQYPNGVSLQLPAGTSLATLRSLLSMA